ncbi:alpha/beta hydrolase [Haloferax mediterranei ATCC 33500]|uniref:Hydrolase n=1 Tax=Haloferax mediterranei (strain ATCC 33500 / DSM 1411 / JCM 8866 / NBRC 14739 / NCIMB 2177 / R-4) TaxID=523841 RepID=I3R833_HALMT|nr:alpha/beta hydrolase [Haloferax mediterranei]AFK20393.1 putative hydrolase [Haloferax mediterranei ATCC 33500]AHZ23756.1 carboxylesterase [Haloferax mediterranei ATCC 33500]ELZ99248.1 putative hydrolase [Haloferax mediterranei ATCC 33500]MDX5986853.1 alpha/beta hydrolase [Haloferax mediterranei ATCC 33500]QCQ76177.1 alpha/beta hydrolase [Haloferax mediterranei ATCC 33500]
MDAATVDHHGRTIAYRHRDAGGTGPTVLCIHGSGGSHAVWRGQFRIASDYPVAALDLSGHGDSDDVDAAPGYETLSAYVDDVVAVAEATGASVLVGNSLGGAVAMTLALERDLDLDALVLTGTGAKLSVLDDLLTWLDNDFDRAISFLHSGDKLLHTDDERFREGSKEAMYDAGQVVTRRDFRSCHTFDVRDDLDQITVPTLALVGEHDRLTPPSYHEYLAAELPDCEFGTVEDAAHLAMLEQPTAFNDAVTSFLDRRLE